MEQHGVTCVTPLVGLKGLWNVLPKRTEFNKRLGIVLHGYPLHAATKPAKQPLTGTENPDECNGLRTRDFSQDWKEPNHDESP
jgi:hypothetical protein